MPGARFIPLPDRFDPGVPAEQAAQRFHDVMATRRSVRMFSDRPVPLETIQWLVRTAGSAPSGANKQPWRFACVRDPDLKREIRLGAEQEERAFYSGRAGKRWLADLAPLGTDASKEFIEIAPWIVVMFRLVQTDGGEAVYYTAESAGIAAGFLLAAAHHAGLVTLTHTPSPMKFLGRILGRPDHERPFLLVPVGYPAIGCTVPEAALKKKALDEIMVVDRG